MARKNTHVLATSDAAVKAKTGHDWATWFDLLDRAGAEQLKHKQITELLTRKHAVPNWWGQMVTVEYERARGLRARHEKADGFAVSVSKTVSTSLGALYEQTANATKRKKWFPKGVFEPSSQTKDKYLRGAWNKTARLEIGFYAKGVGKAQIALQVNKLPDHSSVDAARATWQTALAKLHALLEKPSTSGFDSVVKAFAKDPKVTPPGTGKGFGSGALKVGKKIFAMVSSRAEFVVKLPLARAAELVTSGRGTYFDAGRGKPMKEWVVVTGGERLWTPLAKEARDFAAGPR
jgi:hypothetical protein